MSVLTALETAGRFTVSSCGFGQDSLAESISKGRLLLDQVIPMLEQPTRLTSPSSGSATAGSSGGASAAAKGMLPRDSDAEIATAVASLGVSCLKAILTQHAASAADGGSECEAMLSSTQISLLMAVNAAHGLHGTVCFATGSANQQAEAAASGGPSRLDTGSLTSKPSQLMLQLLPSWGFLLGKALFTSGLLLSQPDQSATASTRQPTSLRSVQDGTQTPVVGQHTPLTASGAGSCGHGKAPENQVSSELQGLVRNASGVIPYMPLLFEADVKPLLQQLPPDSLTGCTQHKVMELYGKLQEAMAGLQAMVDQIQHTNSSSEEWATPAKAAAATDGPAATSSRRLAFTPDMLEQLWQKLHTSSVGKQLSDALMELGSTLCAAVPTKAACNYPACSACDKSTEQQLVGGRGSSCSGCRSARYWCVAHQHEHWKQHKAACKAMSGAAKGAAAGSRKKKGSRA